MPESFKGDIGGGVGLNLFDRVARGRKLCGGLIHRAQMPRVDAGVREKWLLEHANARGRGAWGDVVEEGGIGNCAGDKPRNAKSVPDCLKPTTPQAAAGTRSEPPPSEPCAARSKPRATCTAAPPEDPPGVAPGCSGLTGCGISTGSVSTRRPSSGVADFPTISAPCSSSAAMV